MFEEITKEEYFNTYNSHKKDLCLHASYTDIDGNIYEWSTGNPQWMTEWGFRDSETPLIKAESETVEEITTHKYYKYINNNK